MITSINEFKNINEKFIKQEDIVYKVTGNRGGYYASIFVLCKQNEKDLLIPELKQFFSESLPGRAEIQIEFTYLGQPHKFQK